MTRAPLSEWIARVVIVIMGSCLIAVFAGMAVMIWKGILNG